MEIPAAPALAIIIGTSRGETRRAPLVVDADLVGQRLEAADAGGEDDSGLRRVNVDLSCVRKGHRCGGDGELGEPVDLADLFRAEPLFRFEVTGLAPDDRGMQESLPECVDTHAAAADRTEAGDGDAPPWDGAVRTDAELHQSLDEIRSYA